MARASKQGGGPRSIGSYYAGGDWSDYWRTAISRAGEGTIIVRGYPIEEIIEHLSFTEMAYLMLRSELPTEQQAAGLDLALRAGVDQQFISSAVPPARYVASAAPEAPVAAIASGVLAFGSVTGSPQECAEMILEALASMRTEGLTREAAAAEVIDVHEERGKRIPGLGHPMHKTEEPRVTALRKAARKLGLWGDEAAMLEAIQGAFAARRRHVPINLAGAIACLLAELGFRPLEMIGLAVMGYLPSLIAHTVEEITDGVPLRIIPDALGAEYVGPELRHLPDAYVARSEGGADDPDGSG